MWVTEIEFTHYKRLCEILHSSGISHSVKVGNLKGESTLLLTQQNLTDPGVLPVECYKYIYKTFNAPYCCRDPDWFLHHAAVKALIATEATIRIQCIPKSMGANIAEALIGEEDTTGLKPENISFTNHTHIFQCYYSLDNACFYWGVVDANDPDTVSTSWISLREAVLGSYRIKDVVPICRAYYKMQEIIEHYFPLWRWKGLPEGFQAVDVGASPGGWTQYISQCMNAGKVLAIDPGDVNDTLINESGGRITHCRALAEAEGAAIALRRFGGFSLCVCDINVDSWGAIALLAQHVLPHAHQMGEYLSDEFGYLILTLKLVKNPNERHIAKAVKAVIDALTDQNKSAENGSTIASCVAGWDFKIVHLNANSRNERTIVCKFCNINHPIL